MPPRRRIFAALLPALAFALIVLAIFWRVWTPISGARKAFGWDAQWEYWGDIQLPVDAVKQGELPLWNPHDRAGYPFHADPQVGLLYPPSWILYGLAAVFGAGFWLVTLKILLHFWIGGVGMYALLRRRKLPPAACYAAGVFFLLTYPFSHAMFSALNWGMAWAPWVLLAIDLWTEQPSRRGVGALALTLGLSFLAGGAAATWYTLIVAVPYALWGIVHHARAREGAERRAYLRGILLTGFAAAGLLVLATLAQLTATGNLVAHTVREQRDLEFIGTTAFTADDLFGFLVPRMPGEGPYIGLAAVLWIAVALTLKPSGRSLVLGGIAVAGVLCAWGNMGPFLPFSASLVPPFGFFRRAHRYLYVTMVPLAILGAEGLSQLVALEGEELRRRVGRGVLTAGALGVLIFGCGVVVKATQPNKPEIFRDAFALAFASVIVSTWVTRQVVATDGRWRQVFLGIAAVVLSFDLAFARHEAIERNFYPFPATTHDAEARKLPGVPLEARVYDKEYFGFRPGIRLGIRDLGGYEGDPLALSRYARLLKSVQGSPARLGHANVRYLLEKKPSPANPAVMTSLRSGISELKEVAPEVLWVDRATIVEDEAASLPALLGTRPGTAAVLERKTLDAATAERAAREDQPGASPVAGHVVSASLNQLVAEVDAPADGVVVIHESYYPGWTAKIDGAPAKIVPANAAFRGVLVGPGHHRIEMRYRAPTFVALAALSPLAMLAAALLLAWPIRRR